MLLNKPRAFEVMDRYGLDGLVAKESINIYYLTDYWESMTDGGWPFLDYAVLPRREEDPAALVLPTIRLDKLSELPTWVPNIIAFSDYSGREPTKAPQVETTSDEPAAAPWTGWRVRPGVELTPVEKEWLERATYHADRLAATPAWGLRRALREAGLERATVGADDPRVLHWMQDMGLPHLKVVDATNIFREIRMIKSPDEVELMRKAAHINEAACRAATHAIREGAAWSEIENVFHTELSKRGGRNGHIVGNLGGFRHGTIREGMPLFVDSIGEYRH